MRHHVIAAALIGLVLGSGSLAEAATCAVSSEPMTFGIYQPSSAWPIPGTSTIKVTCGYQLGGLGSSISYSLGIGPGISGGGSVRAVKIAFGTGRLSYQLYIDVARTLVWGDGSGGSQVEETFRYLVLNLACSSNRTAYGAIPNGQWETPGTYTDTVVAMVTLRLGSCPIAR